MIHQRVARTVNALKLDSFLSVSHIVKSNLTVHSRFSLRCLSSHASQGHGNGIANAKHSCNNIKSSPMLTRCVALRNVWGMKTQPLSFIGGQRFFSLSSETKSDNEKSLLQRSPAEFLELLKKERITRCFIVYDKTTGKPKVSHPILEEFADCFAADKNDYREHEGVFMTVGQRSKCLLGAFVWRTARGQACGGIRLWKYSDMESYLRDGLRLGFGMGVKSALAGLWAGGGKGVIAAPEANQHLDPEFRRLMFHDYGDFLTSLNGCYVAAEDVGLNVADLNSVHTHTRYTTCISEDLGGSGNPSVATAKGVICAMEAALNFLDMGTLAGKKVVIQGAGNVASVIIEGLLEREVSHIIATECHQKRVDDVKDMFSEHLDRLTVRKVPMDCNAVLAEPCDILSPCALGNVLNSETIPSIEAKIVCGAANNQLGREEDSELLVDTGVVYISDFLANRMGIVNCSNETYGRLPNDPAIERHFGRTWENSIFLMTKEVLQKSKDEGITPEDAAMQLADRLSQELHPIWPHRSQQIIDALVEQEWHKGHDFWA